MRVYDIAGNRDRNARAQRAVRNLSLDRIWRSGLVVSCSFHCAVRAFSGNIITPWHGFRKHEGENSARYGDSREATESEHDGWQNQTCEV